MKIAISATGSSLDDKVDPRFGRCQYLIIADPDTMQFESMPNPNIAAGGGAGISTAQMIANSGVQVVLTGNCGPNAYEVLSAAGIQVITGVSGKIGDAIQVYKSGQLQATPQPTVDAHFGMSATPGMGAGTGFDQSGGGMERGMGMGQGMGMGRGIGRGMGRGMGRGTGCGMGRGMGCGMGRGMGMGNMGAEIMPMAGPAPQPVSPEHDIEALKAQSQILAQQLTDIQRRIEELGEGKR
jgi:predicted Fe-Mo cluster-binding NifX family protein